MTAEGERDVDVFAIIGSPGEYCISAMLVRGGRNLGTTSYFPRAALAEPAEALGLVRHAVLLDAGAAAGSLRRTRSSKTPSPCPSFFRQGREKHSVHVHCPSRGIGARWVELTTENATQALRMRLAQKQGVEEMLAALAAELDLPELPQRIECFDISHTGGEGTVASCVVFGPEGPMKKEYRRFNITGVTPGDDYAALKQALERRYTRIKDGEIPRRTCC